MSPNTPNEGSKKFDKQIFNEEFTSLALTLKEIETEEQDCLRRLEESTDSDLDTELERELREIQAKAERTTQEMIGLITEFDEPERSTALTEAPRIFREIYRSEEESQSIIASEAPQSLRPIGITKSLQFWESFMTATKKQEKPSLQDDISDEEFESQLIKFARIPMTKEEFTADLQELAEAYNKAVDAENEVEKGIIFEKICQLGAYQISAMNRDPEHAFDIHIIIANLDIKGPKQTLYMYMLGYGLNEATFGFLSIDPESNERDSFDRETFRTEFLTTIVVTRALRQIASIGGFGENKEMSEEHYNAMAEKIAKMTPAEQKIALEIAEKCFAQTEEDLKEGPRALQKAGVRSYIAFYREVRKRIIKNRHIVS